MTDYVVTWTFYVEAESEEEANEKAKDVIYNDRPDEVEVALLSGVHANYGRNEKLERMATAWSVLRDALSALDKEDA